MSRWPIVLIIVLCGAGTWAWWDRASRPEGLEATPESLFDRVKRNDAEAVRWILRDGISPEVLDAERYTPLMHAAELGHTEVMRTLIRAGAKVTHRPKFSLPGWGGGGGEPRPAGAPLLAAVAAGRAESVRVLTEHGALENGVDASTALYLAADGGHDEIVRVLVAAGVVEGKGKGVALAAAIERGHAVSARLLIRAGADVTRGNPTPLQLAVRLGRADVIAELIAAGAPAEARDEEGFLPVTRAAYLGQDQVVRALLESGAVAPELSLVERAALAYAAAIGRDRGTALLAARLGTGLLHTRPRTVHEAFAAFENLGVPTGDARDMALLLAATRGDADEIRRLLALGAEVNVEDWEAVTPLNRAVESGHIDAARMLLAAGANASRHNHPRDQAMWMTAGAEVRRALLSARQGTAAASRPSAYVTIPCDGDRRGRRGLKAAQAASDSSAISRLIDAATTGSVDGIRRALGAGADIDGRDDRGLTALMAACKHGYVDAAALLVSRGAEVDAIGDQYGMTALMLAARSGRLELVKSLLRAGADGSARDRRGHTAATLAANQRLAFRALPMRLRFSEIVVMLEF